MADDHYIAIEIWHAAILSVLIGTSKNDDPISSGMHRRTEFVEKFNAVMRIARVVKV
jgi:hypothetical protein